VVGPLFVGFDVDVCCCGCVRPIDGKRWKGLFCSFLMEATDGTGAGEQEAKDWRRRGSRLFAVEVGQRERSQ
jgi:hypothetical protein